MLKKKKRKLKNKKKRIVIRISEKEKNHAQMRADLYADGNLSKWARYCLENPHPKFLKKSK